ncbi:lactoylglutathione lyase [Devosia pacifica]|uniref:Lactoylglutathione lyase n=1 Tax=Devosia pacifica TaxID=1335967 RepID=A0A918RUU0_9HYPH|nr:VOC family protein [Devosia pacifica]GHA10842.1 lactoylglutathione lyase [Devosia pacifica]
MKRPEFDGLVETCLYVSDVERSRDFYVEIFGFEPLGGNDRIQPMAVRPGQVLILFRRGGTLQPVPVAGSHIPPHDGNGEQHFAFGIPLERVDDWKLYLEGLNIEIESEIAWPQGGRSLYFRDPDRLLVELVTPGLWKNY